MDFGRAAEEPPLGGIPNAGGVDQIPVPPSPSESSEPRVEVGDLNEGEESTEVVKTGGGGGTLPMSSCGFGLGIMVFCEGTSVLSESLNLSISSSAQLLARTLSWVVADSAVFS
jgi:hypothetical protein